MAAKKSFKGSDNAVLKYISSSNENAQDAHDMQDVHDTHDTHDTHNTQDVDDTHDTHDAQDVHDTHDMQDVHDTQDMQDVHDTQDIRDEHSLSKRKQKHIRINMAFYGDNHQYLSYISRLHGISITQYVNNLIDEDKAINKDKIEQAKKLFE